MRRLSLYALGLVPAGLLLLTVSGRWRYGFFLLLRVVVSVCAALLALVAHDRKMAGWMWVMVGLLIVFNPVVPLHLRRDTWRLLDLLVAGIFVAAAFTLQPSSPSRWRGTAS